MHLDSASAANSQRQYHHLYIALFHPQSRTIQDDKGSESLMKLWALYSINTQTSLTTIIRPPSNAPDQTCQPAKTTQHQALVNTTRHPWDVDDLVAALYVGTYLDASTPCKTPGRSEQGKSVNNIISPRTCPAVILGACVDISTLLLLARRDSDTTPSTGERARNADQQLGESYEESTSSCTLATSVLDVIHELGILTLPTSTRAIAEFGVHIATKYDRYGQTPQIVHGLDWMGEGLLDLSWVSECVGQEWMGRAFVDLSFLPDVHEWAQDEDNVFYLADHGCLPKIS